MIFVILILMAAVATAQAIDVRYSLRGFASGHQLEGNRLLVWLVGAKPTLVQFIVFHTAELVLCAASGFTGDPALFGLSVGCLVALAARHIQAIRMWRKLGV